MLLRRSICSRFLLARCAWCVKSSLVFCGTCLSLLMPCAAQTSFSLLDDRTPPQLIARVSCRRIGGKGKRECGVGEQDTARRQELLTLKGHRGTVTGIAFSPDSKRVATASVDKTVKVWDALTGKELFTLTGHLHSVRTITFSQDNKRIAAGSIDETAKLWLNPLP